jgi:hypothetical protein
MASNEPLRIKVQLADGTMSEGTEIAVRESKEPWTELTLDDGTILRVKSVVASVVRVDGQYDQEGNPVYLIKAAQATSVVKVPDALRKK